MTRHGPTAPRPTCAPAAKRQRRHPFRRAAAVGVSAGVLMSVPVAAAHSEPDGADGDGGATPAESAASAPPTSGTEASPSGDDGSGDGDSGETTRPVDPDEVLRLARQQRGTPYEWGADGPDAFDCSGFTRHVFGRLGHPLPRTAEAQYEAVRHVPRSELRTGDLVFSRNGDGDIYHVGIYAGDDRIWAATKPGDTVRTQRIWTDDYLVGRP